MGNLCDVFSFNKETYNTTKNDKKNNNHVPFLDISTIHYAEDAEPPSYSQARNAKTNEYNEFLARCD
jgi:hypothetical protein